MNCVINATLKPAIFALGTTICLLPMPGYGHTGGRDTYGCHSNNALGIYECHAGPMDGRSWSNPGGKDAMLAELSKPPAPPVAVMGAALLTWTANKETNLAGYRLYWGLASGIYQNPSDLGNVTQINLAGLLKGARYYFVITAYNSSKSESGFSNEVSKDVY